MKAITKKSNAVSGLKELEDLFQGGGVVQAIASDMGLTDREIAKALEFVKENEEQNPHETMTFTIPGDPPISKRPRAVQMKNTSGATVGIRVFAADGEAQYTMAQSMRMVLPKGHIPWEGEVELQFNIYRPILSGFSNYKKFLAELGYIRPESKPDYDNFSKILTDAMRGIVFLDDGQVVVGNVNLFYSRQPRLEITVSGRRRRMNK